MSMVLLWPAFLFVIQNPRVKNDYMGSNALLYNAQRYLFILKGLIFPAEVMSAVVDGAEIFVPLDDLMDYKAELARLQKEKKRLEGEVKRVVGKLSNQGFVSKAPEKVVAEERAKKDKYEEMLAKVTDRLAMVERKLG